MNDVTADAREGNLMSGGECKTQRKRKPALSDDQIERLHATLSGLAKSDPDYPPTLQRLFQLSGGQDDGGHTMRAIATGKLVHSRLRTSAKASRGRAAASFAHALVFLAEDTDRVAGSMKLLRSVLQSMRTARTNIFGITQLTRGVPEGLRRSLAVVLRGHVASGTPPAGLGFVREGGHAKFFLLEHVAVGITGPAVATHGDEPVAQRVMDAHPPGTAPRLAAANVPVVDFERVFCTAFDRLDMQSGSHNYVLLHDLRRALPEIARPEFDTRLNELRRNKLFSLDSADGRHVRLTAEQLDAGIREASSLLVYVARRAP